MERMGFNCWTSPGSSLHIKHNYVWHYSTNIQIIFDIKTIILNLTMTLICSVAIDQDKEYISEKDRPQKEHWRQRWEQPSYFLQFSKIFTRQQHSTQLIKSMLLNILQSPVIFPSQQKILNCAWSRFIPVMLSSSIRYPEVLKQAYLAKLKKIVCWQQYFQSKIIIKTYHHINSISNGPTRR